MSPPTSIPFFCLTILAVVVASASVKLDTVSTLYGTYGLLAGIGALPSGVQYPFGMVRLSPDTVNEFNAYVEPLHAGGFYYPDKYIRIFSHVHCVGAGVVDYGLIGVMPLSTESFFEYPDYRLHLDDYNFKSSYVKSEEEDLGVGSANDGRSEETMVARPGYFSVWLSDTKARAELTSGKYSGIHRYSWSKDPLKKHFVLFYPSHVLSLGACRDSNVRIDVGSQEVSGYVWNFGDLTNRIGGVKIFFVARFGAGASFQKFGMWYDRKVHHGVTYANGTDVGAYLEFDGDVVEVYVGISSISVDQARLNLMDEVLMKYSSHVFDNMLANVSKAWEEALGHVEVTGGTLEQQKTFYAALYRTMSAPTLFSEVGGTYLGFDGQVHSLDRTKQSAYYSDMSIWDVHRSQFPLVSLLFPSVMRDIIQSLLRMSEQGGDLPRWPIANGYTGCMIGQHATVSIVDAVLKGVFPLSETQDIEEAYAAMRKGATQPQKHAGRQIEDWVKYGFIPSDNSSKSACLTLAYSFDDGVLARLSKLLGKIDDYDLFSDRSKGYAHVFNPTTQFFCPKSAAGVWDCPKDFTDVFDPRYIEGDAWHWRFFVMHDPQGLIQLFGGAETFVPQLEIFMAREFEFPYTAVPNKYFWVGNEHNLGSPWLFNFANRPDLTAKYVREVMNVYYNSTPSGDPGNDDYGETSSWLVFGSLGFYPIAGSTLYSIASPIFDQVEMQLGSKCSMKITIQKDGCTEDCLYVKSIEVNGKSHPDLNFFDHVTDFVGHCPSIEVVVVMVSSV